MRNFLVLAVHADGPGGSAAVLHGDGLDIFGRCLGLALDAVNLNGFGRGGHRRLLEGRIVQVGALGQFSPGVRYAFEV